MKTQQTEQGRNVRLLRVGEEIRHILAEVLMRGEVHDPVLQTTPITVSEVRVSPDLRHATVFVEPLGGQNEAEVIAALKKNAAYLKGEVGHKLRTKYTPQLKFLIDESFAEGDRIEALLRSAKVKRDLA
jgi:ribosome-binding factor A